MIYEARPIENSAVPAAGGVMTAASTAIQPRRRIDEIKIGQRFRRDLGDIAGLATSIDQLGALLHPIVITPDNRLIAGERRLRAVQLLGWPDVPVLVVNLDEIARGEFAENTVR